MEKFKILSKNHLEQLPKTAGVYFFYEKSRIKNKKLKIIYIGKAANIRERVKNHFNQPSYRDNMFVDKVSKVEFIETSSEIEALILEANLIKKYQPKFNVVWRDDKNYFYVVITKNKQKIPYVYITHQPFGYAQGRSNKLEAKSYKLKANYVGPFVEGSALKKTLKFLRKVFPYYTNTKHPKNKCTWCHLDLCPGPARNAARAGALEGPVGRAVSNGAGPNPDLSEYKKNIKKLILILKGKRKNVLNLLKKEMNYLANEKKFEEAGKIRDKIHSLEQVMSHTKVIATSDVAITQNNNWDKTRNAFQKLLNIKNPIKRIECYDVSNIQGKNATGSMVVFTNGKPDKNQYKKFRIRMKNEPNDIAMLKEVLERRFLHPEWPYPEIILIDGGMAQLNIAIRIKNQRTLFFKRLKKRVYLKIGGIKIISIAKGRQELFIEYPPSHKASEGQRNRPIPLKNIPQEIYNLIKHLDDEAHRFAISYHKKLRRKVLGLDNK